MIGHFTQFLRVISAETRAPYLPLFVDLKQQTDDAWRFRKLVAEQLYVYISEL